MKVRKSTSPLCETYVLSQLDKHQRWSRRSVKDAALISRNHILDVDESVLTSVNLKHLKSLLNKISQVGCFSLRIVNLVTEVSVTDLEQVENGEDLTIVGYKSLTNGVRARNQSL